MKRAFLISLIAMGVLLLPLYALALDYTFYTVDYLDRSILISISSTNGTVLGGSFPLDSSEAYFVYDIGTGTLTDIMSTDGVPPVDSLEALRGINNQGNIVGNDNSRLDGNDFAFHLQKQPDGTYTRTSFNYPYPGGEPPEQLYAGTYVFGINDSNHVAGSFRDPTRIYEDDFFDPPLQYPGARGFLATDITDPSTYVPIDMPGAHETFGRDINNIGSVVGVYDPSPDLPYIRSFLFDGTYYIDIWVNDPAERRTEAYGLNDDGDIVGWVCSGCTISQGYGFLYSQDALAFYKVLYPGSIMTHLYGIDNLGIIVGDYNIGDGTYHGFFAVPDSVIIPGLEGGEVGTLVEIEGTYAVVPEPSTFLLIVIGLAGVGLFRRRFHL